MLLLSPHCEQFLLLPLCTAGNTGTSPAQTVLPQGLVSISIWLFLMKTALSTPKWNSYLPED